MKDLPDFLKNAKDMGQLMLVGAATTIIGAVIIYQSAITSSTITGVCAAILGIIILSTAIAEYNQDRVRIKKIEELIKKGIPYKKALKDAQPEEFVDYNHEDVNDVM